MLEETREARMAPSEWIAITKFFPDATFDADQKSWKVVTFEGNGESHPELQRAIANIIGNIEERKSGDNIPRRKSRDNVDDVSKIADYEKLKEEYGITDPNPQPSSEIETNSLIVQPSQITLLTPTEAKIRIYPRSLRCSRCNYYEIPRDMGKVRSLSCPNCSEGRLRQESILFFCDSCGERQELAPIMRDPDKDGPSFSCIDEGCSGKLHLKIESPRLSDMKWQCNVTGNEFEVYNNCRFCSDFQNKMFKRMSIVTTSQGYLRPLSSAFIYFGENKKREIDKNDVTWQLSKNANVEQNEILNEFGIAEVEVIRNVESVVAIYGYSPEGENTKIKFFKDRGEYKAYVTRTVGKAILVSLDKKKVCLQVLSDMSEKITGAELAESEKSNLISQVQKYISDLTNESASADEAYSWLSELTLQVLSNQNIANKKFLGGLFKLLHSVEHLLVHKASLVSGLDETSFGGTVMVNGCGILIYERANVGAGGIDYIYTERLLEWIRESIAHVRDCRYDCSDGCVKCLFIRDPMCHPFWPHEIDRSYLLPNSLLSRSLLSKFWGLNIENE